MQSQPVSDYDDNLLARCDGFTACDALPRRREALSSDLPTTYCTWLAVEGVLSAKWEWLCTTSDVVIMSTNKAYSTGTVLVFVHKQPI